MNLFKTILSAALALTVFTQNAPAAIVDADRAEIIDKNYLKNPGFENGKAGWTASGGTFNIVTSGSNFQGIGKASATWDSSSAGQTFTAAAFTIPNGLAGNNGLFRCKVMTPSGTATHTMGVWDGSTLVDSITIPSSPTAQYVEIPRPFGAAGTTATIRFTSVASNEPLISVDDCSIGQNIHLFNMPPQARKLGSIHWAGTASCFWTSTSTSFANFSADADCPTPTVTGILTAPGTKIPAFGIPSLPKGTLFLVASAGFDKSAATTAAVSYRFSDGTNSSSPGEMTAVSTTELVIPHIIGSIDYATNQNALTINIQGLTNNASTTVGISSQATGEQLHIDAYFFPTQDQQAVRVDTSVWRVDANISGANPSLGTSSFSTYTGIEDASLTLTNATSGIGLIPAMIPCSSTNSPSGTTCSSGSESIGVSFTIPRAGDARACATFSHQCAISSSGSCTTTFEIVETPNNAQTISQEGKGRLNGGFSTSSAFTLEKPYTVCGTFNFAQQGQKTLRLMAEQAVSGSVATSVVLADAASTAGQRDVHWEVYPIDTPVNAPLLVGSVTSNTTGLERVERVLVNSTCTSSPCTVASQTGSWVSSITRASTGNYTINFTPGTFSALPACFVQMSGTGNPTSAVNSESSSAFNFITYAGSTATATDTSFRVFCIGAR